METSEEVQVQGEQLPVSSLPDCSGALGSLYVYVSADSVSNSPQSSALTRTSGAELLESASTGVGEPVGNRSESRQDECEPVGNRPERRQLDAIIALVAAQFALTAADLTGPSREKEVTRARQLAMWICRRLTPQPSLPTIGRAFNRSHATVLEAVRGAEALLEAHPDLRAVVLALERAGASDAITQTSVNDPNTGHRVAP